MSILFSVVAGITLLQGARGGSDPLRDDTSADRIEPRIIRRFDFDERKLGNFEDWPKFWNQLIGSNYPRFLKAGFDEAVGHAAPPSFRLNLQGGSIRFHYLAKDIPVHPGSDYRVTAWIRPHQLTHAAASLHAYYLDAALRKMEHTERRSVVVRGAGTDESWTRVVIDLPGGFEHARWIGLSCGIEQPPAQKTDKSLYKRITYHDIHGAAWFDDITVMRLPHVGLTLSGSGNIFRNGEPAICTVHMEDLDGAGLRIDLRILDADGRTVESHPLRGADLLRRGGLTLRLGNLPLGRYVARLSTRVGDRPISIHEQTFLRLGPDLGAADGSGKGFGVILSASSMMHPALTSHLLEALSPDLVKLPIWRPGLTDQAIVRGDPLVDQLLESLKDAGTTLIGVLESPPASLAQQYSPPQRSLLDILASDPNRWRPHLALPLTRYGHRINAWQMGPDRAAPPAPRPLRQTAMTNLRIEIAPLLGMPRLVMPRSVEYPLAPGGAPADVLALQVPSHLPAAGLAAQLDAFAGAPAPARWATLEAAPSRRYARRERLIDFARRLIAARTSGLEAVFVRQPWRFDDRDGDVAVVPTEEFILLRTLNQTLGGLHPVMPVRAGPDRHAWLFADRAGKRGALAVWSDADGDADESLVLDLGPSARVIDLWGNVRKPDAATGGLAFRVGALPVIIHPVRPWRAEMLARFVLDKPILQPTVRYHERVVTLTNTHDLKLNGELQLEPPPGWRVRPKRVTIDLPPGRSRQIALALRIPTNQAAGAYELIGHLSVEGKDFPSLTLRAPLAVQTPGLDVNVLAYRQGAGITVLQRVTNRTSESVNLRTYLISPDRIRDVRLIRNLTPGQTAVRTYAAGAARSLAGRPIRVSVEQIGGPLRHNAVLTLNGSTGAP